MVLKVLKLNQTKLDSFIEACINVLIGFGISVLANFVIFPLVGVSASTSQILLAGIFMTFVSVARSYFVRRCANKWLTPARLWLVGKFNKV